jgi:hypothetical protein
MKSILPWGRCPQGGRGQIPTVSPIHPLNPLPRGEPDFPPLKGYRIHRSWVKNPVLGLIPLNPPLQGGL